MKTERENKIFKMKKKKETRNLKAAFQITPADCILILLIMVDLELSEFPRKNSNQNSKTLF